MVTEPFPGLRFDIYERVHAADHVSDIDRFDEIELIPDMLIHKHEDQILLKGKLQLQGTYFAKQDNQTRILVHEIPVEITIPSCRVRETEKLQIEIENFDVDVCSGKSLNITGVLILQGVQSTSLSAPTISTIRKDAESETLEAELHSANATLKSSSHEQKSINQATEFEQAEGSSISLHDSFPVYAHQDLSTDRIALKSNEDESVPTEFQDLVFDETEKPQVNDQGLETEAQGIALEQTEEMYSQTEPPKDVKILNPLHPILQKEKEMESQIKAYRQTSFDHIDWQKICKPDPVDMSSFKRLRMCIVQKNETLEQISQRHQVKLSELQRLNPLVGDHIQAGQILQLP